MRALHVLLIGLLALGLPLAKAVEGETPAGEAEAAGDCLCLDATNWPGKDGTWAAIVTGAFGYVLDSCNADQTAGVTTTFGAAEFVAVVQNGDNSTCTWGNGTEGANVQNTSTVMSAEEAAVCRVELAKACP